MKNCYLLKGAQKKIDTEQTYADGREPYQKIAFEAITQDARSTRTHETGDQLEPT